MFPRSLFPASFVPVPLAAAGPPDYWFGDFTEDGIIGVRVDFRDINAYISWMVSLKVPTGVYFQVYINKQLKWHGPTMRATVPVPPGAGGTNTLHVGRVSAANQAVNYGGRLYDPPGDGNRARLNWEGGRWIDPDIDHFNIYMEHGDEVVIGPETLTAAVPAAPGGIWGDGYGRGPHGRGPHGRGIVPYEWTSRPLERGLWTFTVLSADRMGNLSADNAAVTLEVTGPPPAPPSIRGRAAWIESYDPQTRVARLAWNPSEG